MNDWAKNPQLETLPAGTHFQDVRGTLWRLDRHGDCGVVHASRLDGSGASLFAACASVIVLEKV